MSLQFNIEGGATTFTPNYFNVRSVVNSKTDFTGTLKFHCKDTKKQMVSFTIELFRKPTQRFM